MKINKNMITTALELPHYSIVTSLGIVRGIQVRSLSALGNLSVSIETFFGGRIRSYTKLCEQTREEAFYILVKQAEQLGANAIIGVRYDANEVAPGITEVLAYGTAVIVEKT